MASNIDIPKKYVWRRWRGYRLGKIALKVCPNCEKQQVNPTLKRCPKCGQLLDWTDEPNKIDELVKIFKGN